MSARTLSHDVAQAYRSVLWVATMTFSYCLLEENSVPVYVA
jgi:hypothetical protein